MLIDFDALLCHHLADEAAAGRIRARLAASGLHVRADDWNLQPGFAWPAELDRELDRSAACLLLESGADPPPWAHPALAAALA
ncbi:MAG TPA: toll/interleukin-1 receptor domain-containing protein, partial [Herpetosiphonaceae bacterium]